LQQRLAGSAQHRFDDFDPRVRTLRAEPIEAGEQQPRREQDLDCDPDLASQPAESAFAALSALAASSSSAWRAIEQMPVGVNTALRPES